MPICASPDATFDFHLVSDADKPDESRPAFVCRFRTNRDWHAAKAKLDSLKDVSDEDCFAGMLEVLNAGITGIKHMPGYRDFAHVFDYLDDNERWELAWGHLIGQRMTEAERKNWLLQRASGPAPSATAVTPASASMSPAAPAPSLTTTADSAPGMIPTASAAVAMAS